ncbi:tRNA (adenosine(37)-N6)-dimethylallyltransferase MiaA [Buchnera aphidicola]|uniref:tRNA (adenosine(37)-N6)-dimethylallyltransferase MiaA n=1 Tax=Buchnera aphidicola TaxID=9 RepID=UPI0030ED15A8
MKNTKKNLKQFPLIIFLMGPTASNKTFLAMELHKYFPIEIISVDSALIYKDLNIGIAKPSKNQLLKHPHRLVNIKELNEYYSVKMFYHDVLKEINQIISLNKIPFLVGGTMFYYKVLLYGLSSLPKKDLNIRNELFLIKEKQGNYFLYEILKLLDLNYSKLIHPNDTYRLLRALEVIFISKKKISYLLSLKKYCFPYHVLQLAIFPKNRNWLNQRIFLRLNKMIDLGFQKEVEFLFFKKKVETNFPSMKSIGYKEMWSYILGKITYDQMFNKIFNLTKSLSKRQITWLKSWENLNYFDSENKEQCLEKLINKINVFIK